MELTPQDAIKNTKNVRYRYKARDIYMEKLTNRKRVKNLSTF